LTHRELMRQATKAYRTLLKHLEGHATLTPSNEYQLLIDHLNGNTTHFNEMVERRKNTPASELLTASDAEETAAG